MKISPVLLLMTLPLMVEAKQSTQINASEYDFDTTLNDDLHYNDTNLTSVTSVLVVDPRLSTSLAVKSGNPISLVLDAIMANYSKYVRPDFDGPPVEVLVSISVRNLGPVSEKEMDFTIDCYFRQRWIDRRLKFSGPLAQLPLNVKFLKEIWRPDTCIRNGKEAFLHMTTVPNKLLRLSQQGQILVSQRLSIKARCPMFLEKFPMDVQWCPLEFGSLGYSNEDIVYKWIGMDVDKSVTLSQYVLLDVTTGETIKRSVSSNDAASVLFVRFKLVRQQGYYLLQIYAPCVMTVCLSWISFWLHKEASAARVALGAMTILTISLLGFGVRNELPIVSYSTALDVYIIVSVGFVFAAFVEYAIVNFAQYNTTSSLRQSGTAMIRRVRTAFSKTRQLNDENRFLLNPYQPALSARAMRRTYGTMSPYRSRYRGRFFRGTAVRPMVERTSSDRAATDVKNADWIDASAKVAFPLAYVLFNVGYWILFLYIISDVNIDEVK